jgi:hypothetical protein
MGLEIVGMLLVALVLGLQTSTWQMAPGLLIYGAGVGFASAQLTNVLLSDVPVEQSGQASGAQSTTRQIGAALGIAFLGTVLFTGIGSLVAEAVLGTGASAEQAAALGDAAQSSAGTAVPGIEDPVIRTAAEQGIVDAAQRAIYSAVFFVFLGLIATLKLPDDLAIRRRKEAEAAAAEGSADGPVTAPAVPATTDAAAND